MYDIFIHIILFIVIQVIMWWPLVWMGAKLVDLVGEWSGFVLFILQFIWIGIFLSMFKRVQDYFIEQYKEGNVF